MMENEVDRELDQANRPGYGVNHTANRVDRPVSRNSALAIRVTTLILMGIVVAVLVIGVVLAVMVVMGGTDSCGSGDDGCIVSSKGAFIGAAGSAFVVKTFKILYDLYNGIKNVKDFFDTMQWLINNLTPVFTAAVEWIFNHT